MFELLDKVDLCRVVFSLFSCMCTGLRLDVCCLKWPFVKKVINVKGNLSYTRIIDKEARMSRKRIVISMERLAQVASSCREHCED